jgi:hypothetical protein
MLVTKRLKKVDELLTQKSINAAKLRGDEYNGFLFSQMDSKRLTDSERTSCNIYLFGSEYFHKTVEDLGALP